jgi:hypothetical protein
MIAALLPILGTIGSQIANSFFPDPKETTKRQEMENAFNTALVTHSADIEKAAASIINTEASSKHWLAANWRPITMLIFVGLIVARWTGFTAPGMTEAEYVAVYEIIKIGLGGYVVGRSAEKIIPGVIAARKDK